MAFQIGRITGLNEPMDWSNTGDVVTVKGSYKATSVNDGLNRREQLLGLAANPDEPIVPVLIDGETRVNGFYRVLGVRILTDVFTRQQGNLEYQVDLERVPSFAIPAVESMLTGALMVNDLGVVAATTEPFHAYISASTVGATAEYGMIPAFATIFTEARPIANVGGDTLAWVRMQPVYTRIARWSAPPAGYYVAACTIAATTPSLHTVVGQQEAPDAANWVLSNGLVSLAISGGYFSPTWADSTHTYRSGKDFYFSGAAVGSMFPQAGMKSKILRNSPEQCVLRVPLTNFPLFTSQVTNLDLSIRRGSRIISCYLTSAVSDTWQVLFRTAIACTAITGGIVITANDANSNRVLLCSAKTAVNDLVNGKLTANAAKSTFDAGASFELAGTASVNRDTAQSQVYQYLAAQAERQQVVGR